jgi:uncharacterized protein YndB with AHSA1/START domain
MLVQRLGDAPLSLGGQLGIRIWSSQQVMAYKIARSINIKRSPEQVWRVIQDPARRIEWDARVKSCRQTSPGDLRLGSTFDMIYDLYGFKMPMTLEYISWQPFTQSAVRSTSAGLLRGSLAGTWLFVEELDGSTTWTTKISLRSESNYFAKLIEQTFGRYTGYLTAISQERLKRLVESAGLSL